jgi:hypothetical protein
MTSPVRKQKAFDSGMKRLFPNNYVGMVQTNKESFVAFHNDLSDQELKQLTEYAETYSDPDVFFDLIRTETHPGASPLGQQTKQVMIFTNRNEPDIVLDSIKSVVEFEKSETCTSSKETAVLKITIYDITRDWRFVHTTLDVSSMLAENSIKYQTIQLDGLHDKMPNHDCVWQIEAAVDHPDLKIRLHGLQSLFFKKI